MAVCGRCREDNPARARFCLACGTELGAGDTDARKIITVLFADMVDSTGLGERLDPEALRAVMNEFFTCAEEAIVSHGGVVEKFIGDAVMAVFGIPQAHEDDALRAIRAAVQLQKSIGRLNRAGQEAAISIRIGINSGEVLASSSGDGRSGVIGDAVNAAARLEKLASPGGIVIGGATKRLVRGAISSESMGPVEIRGKAEPIDAHIVLAVYTPSTQTRNFEAPMVGRSRELAALQREYERVAEDKVCVLFTLLGPAGIGKSRLIAELTTVALDPPRVFSGRCLPYGDGITYWPIAEAITGAAHISDRDSQEDAMGKLVRLVEGAEDDKLIANLVAQLIGITEQTASQEETFWAVRKLFETLGGRGPIVLIFDDIHWAEDALLDLIDNIVDGSEGSPILVACLARPELLEVRPTWAGGKLNATTMLLESLKESESRELFTGLLGDTSAIDTILPRILEVSGGNPFFLEETIAMLVDEGALENVDGRWVAHAPPESITIPPTITALLTARLDQLSPSERTTIEIASVMGKVFASQAIRDMTTSDDSDRAFESLSRKGLLRLDQEDFAGEEMYRFRHILIRDAAYQGIPKERRAEVHERYADWLVTVLGDRSVEYEEIIAYHLEQVFIYRKELHAGADLLTTTRHRAYKSIASAGRRALARGDCSAAISLLKKAQQLDEELSDPLITIDLAEAMSEGGDNESAESILRDAIANATRTGNVKVQQLATLYLENILYELESHRPLQPTHELVNEAIEVLTQLDDHIGLSYAYRLRAYLLDTAGRSTESQAAIKHAIDHAARAGDERRVNSYRRILIGSISWGPIHLSDLRDEVGTFLQEASGANDLRSTARALAILGMAQALQGDVDPGRARISESKAIYDKLGQDVRKAWTCFEALAVELAAGDLAAAETELRAAVAILDRHQERAVLPTVLALLAHVRCRQGDVDEAIEIAERARSMSGEDDVLTQIKWRSALALARARQGDQQQAQELARESISIAEGTEYLDWTADSWLDLAHVLSIAQDEKGAADAARRAISLYERKGITVFAERARELIGAG